MSLPPAITYSLMLWFNLETRRGWGGGQGTWCLVCFPAFCWNRSKLQINLGRENHQIKPLSCSVYDMIQFSTASNQRSRTRTSRKLIIVRYTFVHTQSRDPSEQLAPYDKNQQCTSFWEVRMDLKDGPSRICATEMQCKTCYLSVYQSVSPSVSSLASQSFN